MDGPGLAVSFSLDLLPAPMVTVDPCRAAVGLLARGPDILSATSGLGAGVERALVTELVEAELLKRSLRSPEGSGGVKGRVGA